VTTPSSPASAIAAPRTFPRRRVLAGAALGAGASTIGAVAWLSRERATQMQAPTGWLHRPLPVPDAIVVTADGRAEPLPRLLAGKLSAVQLMFTGCNTSCSTQGALFAALAPRVAGLDAQCLSISIDVLGDGPAALAAWQQRFGAHPQWAAAVAPADGVDRLAAFLKGRAGAAGTHTAQVFVFDRAARLRYRTGDAPAIGDLQALFGVVDRDP
jgi:protein SCO1